MNFNTVIGQSDIVQGLKNALSKDKVGHAYVFSGPKGIGKKTVAGIFSALLLCTSGDGENSCDSCTACNLANAGSNPDLNILQPSGNSIGVDEIRSIQADIIIKPVYSKRKVYLILDADKMTLQAQNCLLKTLEDPPAYAVIIMTVTNFHSLLETIRSRSLKLSFRRNSDAEIRYAVKDKLGNEPPEIAFITACSNGIIGTAFDLADSDYFRELRDNTISSVFRLKDIGAAGIYTLYDFFEKNKSEIDIILEIIITIYRDLLIFKETQNEYLLINQDKKVIIIGNANKFRTKELLRNIDLITETRTHLKYNSNFQLTLEVMLMKLQKETF